MIGNTRLYAATLALATMDSSAKDRMEVAIKNLSVIRESEHDIDHKRWKRIQAVIANSHTSSNETIFKKQAEEIISIWLETIKN